MRHSLVVLLVLALVPASVLAQDSPPTPTAKAPAAEAERWHLITDGDLYTVLALTGDPNYSLHMSLRSPDHPAWIAGLGFFGGNYPGFYQDIIGWASGVDNDDWEVGIDGVLLRAFYFLDPARKHLFLGAHLGVLRWDNRHEPTGSRARFNQPVLWPAIGYRWFPGDGLVFLSFWAGAGILGPSFGGERDGPTSYEDLRVLPFAATHLGVEI